MQWHEHTYSLKKKGKMYLAYVKWVTTFLIPYNEENVSLK